ncbi:Putative invertase inhibitor [Apostasia shenzhenica]|uniref:Invertase inhibitor n=1 Tax=Apostasia shenzhenica TaxID=1088818 RepID=A0A2I0AYQ8_9ASPA|nr:Putative invertase inhibitor [Apostasia shenzhenica]
MAKQLLFFFFFIVVLFHPVDVVTANIVTDTCWKISHGNSMLNNQFCVSLFNSVPSSHNTDMKGLTLISIQLTTQKAKQVLADIYRFLGSTQPKDPKIICLKSCQQSYLDAIGSLNDSVQMIETKDYIDAQMALSAAFDAGSDCERSFSESKISSLLSNDNDSYTRVAYIPLLIVADFFVE